MGVKFWLSAVISVIVFLKINESEANSTDTGVVFCYYNSASTSRSGDARFGADDIPLDLCTHVIYSSIRPTSDGNITFSQPQGSVEGKSNSFEDFVALRESANASKVKLMASLGGSEEDSVNFSIANFLATEEMSSVDIVNNEALRKKIIDVLRSFVQSNNLDGIDLLWKYPTLYGGASTDKVKYTTFIHDLKTSFGGQYLLSAAVGPTESAINASYYVQEINEYVDYINLLSFGFNDDGTENVTGVNAPLYAQSDTAEDAANNVNASVTAWIAKGASPSKLVLGLGAVGKTFELVSLNDTGVAAPTLSAGAAGLTGVNGEISYLEICTDQCKNADQWNITEVDGSFVYANKNLLWVAYDNINTIFAKGEYAKNHGLAGISLWSLDQADFNDACGDKYLLLKSAISGYKTGKDNMNIGKTNTTQEPQKATPSTQSSTKNFIKIITDDDDCDDNDITARNISSTVCDKKNDKNKNTITVKVDDLSKDNATFVFGPGPQVSSPNDTVGIFDGFEPITDTNKEGDVKTGENTQTIDTRSITVNVDDLLKVNANETIILGPGPQITNLNGTIYDAFQPKSATEKQDNTAKSDGDIQKVGNNRNFINFKVDDLLKINANETIVFGPGPQISTLNDTINDGFSFQPSTGDNADKTSKDTQEVKKPTFVTVNVEDLLKDSDDPALISTPGPQVIPPKGTMIDDLDLDKDKTDVRESGKTHEDNFFEWVGNRIMRVLHFVH